VDNSCSAYAYTSADALAFNKGSRCAAGTTECLVATPAPRTPATPAPNVDMCLIITMPNMVAADFTPVRQREIQIQVAAALALPNDKIAISLDPCSATALLQLPLLSVQGQGVDERGNVLLQTASASSSAALTVYVRLYTRHVSTLLESGAKTAPSSVL
jgi:hypothetical protein